MSTFEVQNLFNVKGKVVLITGVGTGIGKMIATGFCRNGAKVYITSRTAKNCESTASELNALGPGTCIAIPADLQRVEEVERLVNELALRESVLHVLVNNAGTAWATPLDDFPDSAFTKVMTLNVQRVFTLTQKVLPLLRAAAGRSKEGKAYADPARIINIGSVEGLGVPDQDTYSYSASKAALHHLSRHLAGRLGPEGITSNTIACGPFPTKMLAHTMATMGDSLAAAIPLRRLGLPEDVAATALFLSSAAGSFITGSTITLDGGLLVAMPSVLSKL